MRELIDRYLNAMIIIIIRLYRNLLSGYMQIGSDSWISSRNVRLQNMHMQIEKSTLERDRNESRDSMI